MGTCTSEEWIAMKAVAQMTEGQVFAFLLEDLSENVIEGVIRQIRNYSPTELKAKVGTEFLVKKSIEAAKEYQCKLLDKPVSDIQKMLRISAKLMRSSFKNSGNEDMGDIEAVQYCLQLFNYLYIGDNEQGFAKSMLRDCGEKLDMTELRAMLNEIGRWVTGREKCITARNLLCAGYIEHNGAEQAFVALENDLLLSKVTTRVPYEERIDALEKALVLVNVNDEISVNRARALFYAACQWPGEEQAIAAVLKIRSDLVEHFTDDSGSTTGKKAE